MLLKKVRANQPLTGTELKELKCYEVMTKNETKTSAPPEEKALMKIKKPTAAALRRGLLESLGKLAAAAVTLDEAENVLGMEVGALKKMFAADAAAKSVWQKARIDTLVAVKTQLLNQTKDGKPVAARHIERMLMYELKEGTVDWMRLTTNQLSEAFGVTRQTIHTWFTKHGCPRNADGTYALGAMIQWFERFTLEKASPGGMSAASAMSEFQTIKTERLRMELAEKSGKLLDRTQVVAGLLSRIQYLKQTCDRKLMELTMQCDKQPPEAIAGVLKKFFDDLCRGFSQIPEQLRLPEAAAAKLEEVMGIIEN